MTLSPHTLVIGIGNVGRKDDGIGWAFLDRLQEQGFSGSVEYRYQLNVEDAELISHYSQVLMVDASQEALPDGYRVDRVVPNPRFSFSTHEVAPDTIAYLCGSLFGADPEIFLLQIRGEQWGLGHGLSPQAQERLSQALGELGVKRTEVVGDQA